MSDASTARDPAALYLDLIKKTLSYTIWDEPGVPIETFNYRRPPLRRAAFSALSWLFGASACRCSATCTTRRRSASRAP